MFQSFTVYFLGFQYYFNSCILYIHVEYIVSFFFFLSILFHKKKVYKRNIQVSTLEVLIFHSFLCPNMNFHNFFPFLGIRKF